MRLCWQAMASCCWKIPEPEQADLSLIAVREKLVERRTEAVNLVRGDGEGGGEPSSSELAGRVCGESEG